MLAPGTVAVAIIAMVKNKNEDKKLMKYSVCAFFLARNVKSKKGFVGNKKDSCLFMRLCIMVKNMGTVTKQIYFESLIF